MNLAFHDLSADDFRYNLRFLEKKRNLIMDGDFVKLVYSDESTAINSLFFVCLIKFKPNRADPEGGEDGRKSECPFGRSRTDQSECPFCTIWFSPYDSYNQVAIQQLIQYEKVLIEEYAAQTKCCKSPMFLLKNQLLSGNTRMHKIARATAGQHKREVRRKPPQILVKISGIWESHDSFGITYKFIEVVAFD
jgi:hypothetical protein